ncbi:unnamed protein product, partial [Polarella glacialis]
VATPAPSRGVGSSSAAAAAALLSPLDSTKASPKTRRRWSSALPGPLRMAATASGPLAHCSGGSSSSSCGAPPSNNNSNSNNSNSNSNNNNNSSSSGGAPPRGGEAQPAASESAAAQEETPVHEGYTLRDLRRIVSAMLPRYGQLLSAEFASLQVQAQMAETKNEKVQCFGRKKTSVAVALVRTGSGQVRLNGCPLHTVKPDILRVKVYEPLLLLGKDRCSKVDIRLRVKGGGFTGQVYALRQAIAKGIVAYYQKFIDEASKKEIKDILMAYDRSLIVADPRRCEPKKFGGRSARSRFQKSYR